jgi:hypothetical protein
MRAATLSPRQREKSRTALIALRLIRVASPAANSFLLFLAESVLDCMLMCHLHPSALLGDARDTVPTSLLMNFCMPAKYFFLTSPLEISISFLRNSDQCTRKIPLAWIGSRRRWDPSEWRLEAEQKRTLLQSNFESDLIFQQLYDVELRNWKNIGHGGTLLRVRTLISIV